jgi:hypothetical protein
MNAEKPSDEIYFAEFAKRLREEIAPLCPQFRSCDVDGLFPVRGYCVLSRSPGWLMIPRIEVYRNYCTRREFVLCSWFCQTDAAAVTDRGGLEDPAGPTRGRRGPDAGESRCWGQGDYPDCRRKRCPPLALGRSEASERATEGVTPHRRNGEPWHRS